MRVVKAKSESAIAINTGPKPPRVADIVFWTYAAPASSAAGAIPEESHMRAVAVQMRRESMNTDSI